MRCRRRFLLPAATFLLAVAAPSWCASFPTVESLNDHIEANWGRPEMRKDLHALAQDGVKRFPGNAEILGRKAFLEYQMGLGDWGAALIARALAMDPQHWMIRVWAENIYINRAFNEPEVEAAVDLFARAAALKPAFAGEAAYWSGTRRLWQDPSRPEEALSFFEKAEKAGYAKDGLYRDRGSALHVLKRYPEAEAAFRRSLEVAPGNPHTLYAYASLRYDMGDLAGWASLLEEFLRVDAQAVRDNEVNVRENLASAYASRLGSLADARRQWQALIDGYPEHEDRAGWTKALFRLSPRTIRGTWTLSPPAGADASKGIEVVLPAESAYQKLEAVAFDPKPQRSSVTRRDGNNYALLYYPQAPARITVGFRMAVSAATIREGGFSWQGEEDPAAYLGRDTDFGTVLDPKDADLLRLAAEIAGGIPEPLEKARRIHQWIMDHFTYKVVFPSSIAEYLRLRQGECGGFALVFVALCRAAGIPARRAFSPLLEYPDASTLGSHATSEFWVQGKGWIPVNNTANVFASTSEVLTLWRNVADGKRGAALYPDLKGIEVEYKGPDGKTVTLRGG